MIKNLSVVLVAGIVFFILCWGVVYYTLNYSKQVEQKERVEYAEQKVNQLNEIYISFLTAVRENRGYRLNREEVRRNNYGNFRDSTLKLLERYATSSGFPQDSVLFAGFRDLIYLRIEDLEIQFAKSNADSIAFQTQEEVHVADSLTAQLAENQRALLA